MKNENNNHLKKALGYSFGIAILVGSTIGAGILRTPGIIAGLLNNYWLIIACWIVGGIYILLGVGSYAELATSVPKAGGSYNYVKRAFGKIWILFFNTLLCCFFYLPNHFQYNLAQKI